MQTLEILTKSGQETKKLGEKLAKELMRSSYAKASEDKLKTAAVLSLEGDLGAGKTTFTQGFAKGLGIKEIPKSPTFVILQIYHPPPLLTKEGIKGRFSNLVHVDAYRLKSADFKALNWKDFIKDKKNIILVEWGNKIKDILPKNSLRILFEHNGHKGHLNRRLIKIIQ